MVNDTVVEYTVNMKHCTQIKKQIKNTKFCPFSIQKEEEKRKAKIDDWERHQKGGGYKSKYKPPTVSYNVFTNVKQVVCTQFRTSINCT